jgi:hypothetical protein
MAQFTATLISKIKWLEKNLGTWPNRLHITAQETYKARTVMNDSHQNLVEVRRSSGEKEWMTREKLAELNKQRALKREQSKALEKQHWNGMKV